jgi:hypothetical protein
MPASVTSPLGAWLLGYGAFLVAVGVAGFLSNPEKAATALLSGGTFGALSMAWGLLLRSGRGWARQAAMATTGLLTLVFAWRATASWLAFLGGQPGKLVAAALITAMLVASVVTLARLAWGDAPTRPAQASGKPGDRAPPEAPR